MGPVVRISGVQIIRARPRIECTYGEPAVKRQVSVTLRVEVRSVADGVGLARAVALAGNEVARVAGPLDGVLATSTVGHLGVALGIRPERPVEAISGASLAGRDDVLALFHRGSIVGQHTSSGQTAKEAELTEGKHL